MSSTPLTPHPLPEPVGPPWRSGRTTIVLLHGWGFHSGVWDQAANLFADTYRLLRIDLPGHGNTPWRPHLQQPQSICRHLRHAVSKRTILIGWSLGGLIALICASIWGERVRRLILVSATPRFVSGRDWPHGQAPATFDRFDQLLADDANGALKRFISLQLPRGDSNLAALQRIRRIALQHPPAPNGLKWGMNQLRHSDARPQLSRLTCPVRMIHGRLDQIVSVRCAESAVKLCQNGRLTEIPGAGHAPMISHSKSFLMSLRNAIDD